MTRLYAATGDGIARLDEAGEAWTVELSLPGSGAQCLAVDPADPDTVYAGLREGGVRRSVDGGRSWIDCELPEPGVFSLAVSAADGAVYAGTEPSRLFRSDDRGESWRELEALLELPSRPNWSFPPRPWTSHVRWIAPSPRDADLLLVGIELGGLMRSTDGGQSWQDHRPGAQPDVHSLAWHPQRQDAPMRPAAAAPPSAPMPARPGSLPTRAATATTPGRSPSTPTTPTAGTCRRALGRSPRTVALTRRRISTGERTANRGSHSPVAYPSPCRQCRMHSLLPMAACSPVSPTASSGKAATAAIAGPPLQLDGDSLDAIVALDHAAS